MSIKSRKLLLGSYDLVLAIGAIYMGYLMISGEHGIFSGYPEEWLTLMPFHGWMVPGILMVIVFGLGNMITSLFSFMGVRTKAWLLSGFMGGILLLTIMICTLLVRELYLASIELLLIGVLQICFSRYVAAKEK